jgi:hypothetical protein
MSSDLSAWPQAHEILRRSASDGGKRGTSVMASAPVWWTVERMAISKLPEPVGLSCGGRRRSFATDVLTGGTPFGRPRPSFFYCDTGGWCTGRARQIWALTSINSRMSCSKRRNSAISRCAFEAAGIGDGSLRRSPSRESCWRRWARRDSKACKESDMKMGLLFLYAQTNGAQKRNGQVATFM